MTPIRKITPLICLLLFLFVVSSVSLAQQNSKKKNDRDQNSDQDKDQRVEKLEAIVKGVWANVVEGEIQLNHNGEMLKLTPGVELQDGDVVVSSSDARAEFLLQPGNYLRMSGETRFRIVSTQYDRLRVELEQGSIACELLKRDESKFSGYSSYFDYFSLSLLRITTARSETFVSDSGLYRWNVVNGGAELIVRKGEAVIDGEKVKEKKIARDINGVVSTSDFDSKSEESFDSWCRERGNQLVQVNRQLKNDVPWAKHKKNSDAILDVPPNDDHGESPFVVSAKPGTVVYADYGAEVTKTDDWKPLTTGTDLRPQDKLRTANYSRVDLMMFPDIFLRIDENSEMIFEELSNDAISVRLVRGAALLEAPLFDRKRLPEFKISGAGVVGVIVSEGNYRWDIDGNRVQFDIRHGRLAIDDHQFDGCRTYEGNKESKCSKKRNDNFDYWSKFRGEGSGGKGRSVTYRYTRLRQRYKNIGFWYRSPTVGYYTFVPYSSTDFESPYGSNYSVVLSPRRSVGMPNPRLPVERPPKIGFP